MNAAEGKVVVAGEGTATVLVDAAVACARCAAGRGCGAGTLEKGRKRLVQVNVAEGLALRSGDRVRLQLAPSHLLRAAWLAYGLPLFAMVLAVAAAWMMQSVGDLTAVAFAVLGLLAGLIYGRGRLQKRRCLQQLSPIAYERIDARTAQAAANRTAGRADPYTLRRKLGS